MKYRDLVVQILKPWVVGGALLLALVLVVATFAAIWLTRPKSNPPSQPTVILNAIRAPTATPILPTALPTATPTATLSPDQITTGMTVQVSGTGGDGLRLRVSPGLDSQIWQVANEAEIFQVGDGPNEVDGYVWWFLVSPEDETRRGWGVADFIKPANLQP